MKQTIYFLSTLMMLFFITSCFTTNNGSDHDKPNKGGDHNGSGEENDGSGIYDLTQESIKIGSKDLKIKLVSVKDSRCPKGTNCFVAGEAKVEIEVIHKGEKTAKVLIAKGLCEGDDGKCGSAVKAGGVNIALLNLYPYPTDPSKPIKQEDYTAKVKIN